MAFSNPQKRDPFSTQANELRYFIYARKSTDELTRQVLSIESQLRELRDFALKNNLNVIAEFQESRTAKAPGRPVFNQMISALERNEADGILAWHSDRLSRNSLDSGRIVYLTDTGAIKDLRLIQEHFDSTPHGKFSLGISFVQNKYYVDNLSENVKRGYRAKVRLGLYPRPAPLGYFNDRNTKRIFPDPIEGPRVRMVFERYAVGDIDLRGLCTFAQDIGLEPKRGAGIFRMSSLQQMLRNVFYIGLFTFNGEIHQGVHEALVSRELFDCVQAVMKVRSRKVETRLKPFRYRGALNCSACQHQITMEMHKGHTYLRCSQQRSVCRSPFVRQERIDEAIQVHFQRIVLPNEVLQQLSDVVANEKRNQHRANADQTAELQKMILDLANRIKGLVDLRLSGQLSDSEFIALKNETVSEKSRLEAKVAALSVTGASVFEPVDILLQQLNEAVVLDELKDLAKMTGWLKNASSNLWMTGPTISVDWKKPYKIVVDWKGTIDKSRKKPSTAKTCSFLRRLLDAVRTERTMASGRCGMADRIAIPLVGL